MLNSVSTLDIKKFLEDIGELLDASLFDIDIIGVSTLGSPASRTLIWINNPSIIVDNFNGAIIAPENTYIDDQKVILVVKNPRYAFAMIIKNFFSQENNNNCISSSSNIPESTTLGDNCAVGNYTTIGKNCRIGNNVKIGNNVVIHDNMIIGNNVVIESGSIIGSSGFGIVKDSQGELMRFPHIGNVIIEDNVEIGANCCIDRGTIGDTIIKYGTKIDNLCHIAHNVNIGKNCIITAKCEVSGSVTIGSDVWLSPSVTIIDGVTIEDNCFIAIGCVVTKNVPESSMALGYPMKIKENTKF